MSNARTHAQKKTKLLPLSALVFIVLTCWLWNFQNMVEKTLLDVSLISELSQCPTANIDIFLVTFNRDFPLTSFVIRSIKKIMPCHGTIHIVVDRQDILALGSWVDVLDTTVQLHRKFPKNYPFLAGILHRLGS